MTLTAISFTSGIRGCCCILSMLTSSLTSLFRFALNVLTAAECSLCHFLVLLIFHIFYSLDHYIPNHCGSNRILYYHIYYRPNEVLQMTRVFSWPTRIRGSHQVTMPAFLASRQNDTSSPHIS